MLGTSSVAGGPEDTWTFPESRRRGPRRSVAGRRAFGNAPRVLSRRSCSCALKRIPTATVSWISGKPTSRDACDRWRSTARSSAGRPDRRLVVRRGRAIRVARDRRESRRAIRKGESVRQMTATQGRRHRATHHVHHDIAAAVHAGRRARPTDCHVAGGADAEVTARLGPFELSPNLTIKQTAIDDNVFNETTNPKRDYVIGISPELTVFSRMGLTQFAASAITRFHALLQIRERTLDNHVRYAGVSI